MKQLEGGFAQRLLSALDASEQLLQTQQGQNCRGGAEQNLFERRQLQRLNLTPGRASESSFSHLQSIPQPSRDPYKITSIKEGSERSICIPRETSGEE